MSWIRQGEGGNVLGGGVGGVGIGWGSSEVVGVENGRWVGCGVVGVGKGVVRVVGVCSWVGWGLLERGRDRGVEAGYGSGRSGVVVCLVGGG